MVNAFFLNLFEQPAATTEIPAKSCRLLNDATRLAVRFVLQFTRPFNSRPVYTRTGVPLCDAIDRENGDKSVL